MSESRRREAATLAVKAWDWARDRGEQQYPLNQEKARTAAENIYIGALWMRNQINGPTKEDT